MRTSARDPLKRVTPCHFLPVGWLHRFRDRFGLKSRKMTGEAASAAEEAAVIPAELAKDEGSVLAAVSGIHGGLGTYPADKGTPVQLTNECEASSVWRV